ncbi:hypothetical protein [Bacillus sp. FJAT-42315]|uniref:hypothetical protein n=1 Tax=Bacillus sp. FJAT-42315 TaxID=2014077 RepID=UPI0018E1FCD0|nr:hypothetical protein [Bacillus sp. FJAT-42315]
MKKISWIITAIGVALMLGGLLYPLDMITKATFQKTLLSGALIMFVGSMVRSYAILKDK